MDPSAAFMFSCCVRVRVRVSTDTGYTPYDLKVPVDHLACCSERFCNFIFIFIPLVADGPQCYHPVCSH